MSTKIKHLNKIVILIFGALMIGYIIFQTQGQRNSLKGYYKIGVILNEIELTSKDMEVIKFVIDRELEIINSNGGVVGRELRVIYLDDKGSPEVAKQVVAETVKDKNLIGYVGCWSSTRSKAISEIVGPARVPFIGGYALTPFFQSYPTMYTSEQGITDVTERLELLLQSKFKRPAFIGKTRDLYSIALLDKLYEVEGKSNDTKVVMEKWYSGDHEFSSATIDTIAEMLSRERSDFLMLSFESLNTAKLLQRIRNAGITIPVFTALGDLGFIVAHIDENTAGELYDVSVVGIPGTFNLRLQELIPGFANVLSPGKSLELQLNFSARLADNIGIIAQAANSEKNNTANIREKINAGLIEYIGGGKIYRGWYDDWYFTKDRAIAGDVLLAWKPASLPRHILSPDQYMRFNDTLRKVPVLFTQMDMIEINRVSDTDGSFYATFYLGITSDTDFTIEQIDFTNAARSETSHEYLLDVRSIRKLKIPGEVPLYNHMYKVSGKFLFEPDLRNYPFDKQKFSIHFQPTKAVKPFLVQPSSSILDDSVFDVRGWSYLNQYVGYEHDIIKFVNTLTEKQQTLPFYKFSYTYVLVRAKIDFFLKVLAPLLVILIVTYFSVFIPLHRFETLEAIQVTSLLASIALYFSAYKPEMEYATISDKIFIFTYIMITSLIGTSILQFVEHKRNKTDSKIARIYQRYIFPAIIVVFTIMVIRN